MPFIEVVVVRRETEAALQLVFWNDLLGHHDIKWTPKSLVKTEVHAGQRDIVVEVYAALGRLQGWEFIAQNEMDEHRARMNERND